MNHLRVTISLCVLISIGFFGSAFAVEIGACCIGGGCLNMPLMTCTQFNGIYQGNTGFCEDEAVSCIASCAEDFDGDGDVDVSGLLQLIAAWGMCP